MAVGSRSAQECQARYLEEQQGKGSKQQPKKATSGKSEQKGTSVSFVGAVGLVCSLPGTREHSCVTVTVN